MNQLCIERRAVWSAAYEGKTEVIDSEGRHTGEWRLSYGKPVRFYPTVSPRHGNVYSDGFGIGVDCDRTLVYDSADCPVGEASVLWVDVEPELNEDGSIRYGDDGEPVVPWDYEVSMVSVSYNFTSVAMKQVAY